MSSAPTPNPIRATRPTPDGIHPHSAPNLSALPVLDSEFAHRHIGPRPTDLENMLARIGIESLDAMADAAVPSSIRRRQPLDLPPPQSEQAALERLRAIAARNQVWRSYLGQGYADCLTPPVIQRHILENPAWYTPYTPYQAEIAQGRLEALLTFQTMICDLTGLDIANASLLDEATAAAEAMAMCHHLRPRPDARRFLVAADCHPQTIDVIQTRARPQGIQVHVTPHLSSDIDPATFAILVQYPATDGALPDYAPLAAQARQSGARIIAATDPLSLALLRPPGEWGADIAVGNTQRFGLPLGYGGPHAAFFATRDSLKRYMPGRLVGVSRDARGRPALRLALQTREQHIRREKATSNICTAQVLLAVIAATYALYHGPDGLRRIAGRIHELACSLAASLQRLGHRLCYPAFFDTLRLRIQNGSPEHVRDAAAARHINLRWFPDSTVGITLDETTTAADLADLEQIFQTNGTPDSAGVRSAPPAATTIPNSLARTTPFLAHPIFHRYRSETELMRYLRRLESRDLSLTTSMIPLGSCTMKLNAAAEMLPITWTEFARLHPFAPPSQAAGYRILFADIERWLGEITGLPAVSLQPNAGSQGEYAGLTVIRRWHESRGDLPRNICLIPASAHGTNPASAAMAGFQVVPVACDPQGNTDVDDLRRKADQSARRLAALMITYPSTHGVFEERIREICSVVHEHGGLVYLDGANMNAQVGLCRPADLGADVCHLNLHKTFAIPHGGGGPGAGPICAAASLAPFLPGHAVIRDTPGGSNGAVAAAPWGSASILPITWMYIALLGAPGLRRASQVAILNANYIARRLGHCFPVLYQGAQGWVAHECILDLRSFKSVTVEDVAKRLMDYGFHAPTISWPVPGTLMIEPTESESLPELDRFCDTMIAIHAEILAVEHGKADPVLNPLKQAPHPAETVSANRWDRPYTREQAAYPVPSLRDFKFWPAVARVDNVYGDRNPVWTWAGFEPQPA
ncbi:MAG: aminomethyl-transferring glycine dehydrogenase [Verrucomicrobia bacterium]|nr:aminomethyl-transferring glycine dehydrogenase [Verrucomicrobiota bacterium]